MAEPSGGGGHSSWSEYSRLVLSELERNARQLDAANEKIERLRSEDLAQLRADIMLLKFQAAMYGSIGGVVFSAVIPFLLKFIK